MQAMWTTRYRMRGMSLISLLLVVSFVLIPVRCDASTAPHSIFVSPNMLNPSAGHEHHMSGAATQSEQTKSIPHHSPVAADADPAMAAMHGHTQTASDTPDSPAERSARDHCASLLASDNDPGSQQPVGATLDLPPTSVVANSTTLQPLDGEPLLLSFGPTSILSGITTPPDAPPPKSI